MSVSPAKLLMYVTVLYTTIDNNLPIVSALRCYQCFSAEGCKNGNLGKNGTGYNVQPENKVALPQGTDMSKVYGDRECEPAKTDEVLTCTTTFLGTRTYNRGCGAISKTFFKKDCPLRPTSSAGLQNCMCFTDYCNGDPGVCCDLTLQA